MRDEEILAAAAQLWQQSQGSDFTMERLTEATGISRASLYRRFGSREAILQRLAEQEAIEIEELSRPGIRTRILEATRTLLNRFGFAGVTIEQIAQEAAVGPATVYRHFGSKETLIEAFFQAYSPRQSLRNLEARADSDIEADLMQVAAGMLEFVHDNSGLIRIFVFEYQGNQASLEKIRGTQGRTITMLADYLAGHMALGRLKRGDPFALALSFMGMLIGLGLIGPHSYHLPVTDPAATARLATQTFLYGIALPHPHEHPHEHIQEQPQEVETRR